jgi:uncharacterized membrane protein YqgA involved in biofilm formation
MAVFREVSGTLLNALTVLVGSTVGLIAGNRIGERFARILFIALGLFTTVTGLEEAFGAHNGLVVLFGLILGGLAGEGLKIEQNLDRFGAWAQKKLRADDGKARVGEGLVTASLLFCIGPLTILGSIANGLTGNTSQLVIKSTLDGFASLALAATLGWGVALSVCTILIVQGGLSLGAGAVSPLLNANGAIIPELVAAGGFLLVGIGLRLLKIADLRPGNFLPALIATPVLVALVAALPLHITP